jgi:rSAM/selenodomain-associated transferase 1
MSPHSNNCVLLFVKSPVRGRVKTRLAAETGEDFAVGLYKCFVEDLISLVENLDVQLRLCFHPPGTKLNFSEWLGEQHRYRSQTGNDLGERLRNAFESAFSAFEEGFSKVVAIGSDSPDLPVDFLRRAFEELESHDAVIGPSSDGGYYLIGFSRSSFLPDAFDNIAWSSDGVFEQTVCTLKQHGRDVCFLPLWHDVDTAANLKSLLLRTKNTPFEKSRTYRYLKTDGLASMSNV